MQFISSASIVCEFFTHHLWTQKCIVSGWIHSKVFKEFRLFGPDLLFLSLYFLLWKHMASQGFQGIPYAYCFTELTFGYFSLLCGPLALL